MEDIERYKTSLIKLWEQSCANQSLKINFSDDKYAIRENIVKLNIKDDLLSNTVRKAFNNSNIKVNWETYTVNNACYYFNIQKKKLSISKIMVDVQCPSTISYLKKEKSIFSSKEVLKEIKIDMNQCSVDNIDTILRYNSNNIINYNNSPIRYGQFLTFSVYFALLTYNNIFIPITLEEYDKLRCFEMNCRKKDDMEDVYRNLTLLSPSEYKEFLMWKEAQKVYDEINPENLTKSE